MAIELDHDQLVQHRLHLELVGCAVQVSVVQNLEITEAQKCKKYNTDSSCVVVLGAGQGGDTLAIEVRIV